MIRLCFFPYSFLLYSFVLLFHNFEVELARSAWIVFFCWSFFSEYPEYTPPWPHCLCEYSNCELPRSDEAKTFTHFSFFPTHAFAFKHWNMLAYSHSFSLCAKGKNRGGTDKWLKKFGHHHNILLKSLCSYWMKHHRFYTHDGPWGNAVL